MNSSKISTPTFNGKIIFDKKMTKSMLEYANKVLDSPYLGKTARERIATKNYDINIYGHSTKKTITPRISFSCSFKLLKDKKTFNQTKLTREFTSDSIPLKAPVQKGAEYLNFFLMNFERYRNKFNFVYNSFGEKILAHINKFFNIRK